MNYIYQSPPPPLGLFDRFNFIYPETPFRLFDCYIFSIRVYNNIKINFNNVLLHYCIEKIHSLLFLKKQSFKHALLKCLYLTLTLALTLTK